MVVCVCVFMQTNSHIEQKAADCNREAEKTDGILIIIIKNNNNTTNNITASWPPSIRVWGGGQKSQESKQAKEKRQPHIFIPEQRNEWMRITI